MSHFCLFRSPFDAIIPKGSIETLRDIIQNDEAVPDQFETKHECIKNHSDLFEIYQYCCKLLGASKKSNINKPG